jgi:hypothetical protein
MEKTTGIYDLTKNPLIQTLAKDHSLPTAKYLARLRKYVELPDGLFSI